MVADPYRDFAGIYDEWQRLYPRPLSLSLAPMIRREVGRRGVPRRVLADLACGTGTFAWWWQHRHPAWTVYGTDRSAAMVRQARDAGHSPGDRDGPSFLVQDLKKLALPEPAGILTCLFDSLNHVTKESDLLRIFRLARRALAPGGMFIFDVIEEKSFARVFTGASVIAGKDLYVGIETEFVRVRGLPFGMAQFTFFRRSGAHWRRVVLRIRERCWRGGEIQSLLAQAGLVCESGRHLDPGDGEEFTVPRRLWICRREEESDSATRKSRRAR